MLKISRSLEWDAGHRVTQHESKCRHVHGHRYKAIFEFTADSLDTVGRVIDYGVIKQLMGPWIEEKLDHGYIGKLGDWMLTQLMVNQMKYFVMPRWPNAAGELIDAEPTGENIARLLFETCQQKLDEWIGCDPVNRCTVQLLSVTVWETPNCSATYTPDPPRG